MSVKTLDELRRTPAHVVCEHGASQRACDVCEDLALDAENDELKRRVAELETELSLRKGVRYPDHRPSDECVQIWTYWHNDCTAGQSYQWIVRNRCSLVDGEWWRVLDDSSPYESKEGGA